MDDEALVTRMWDSMESTFRLFAHGAPDSHIIERDGVFGLIVPATPDRSVLNSVFYEDADRLERALGELAVSYERAGVRAWTVWLHPGDEAARRLLRESGHKYDAAPTAMGRELDGVFTSIPQAVEWTRHGSITVLTQMNDAAYGWEATRPWTRALGLLPPERVHTYTANDDDRPACGLMTHDHEENCEVWLVATLASARGRGLAGALLGQALLDARARGCTTTTLQSTKLGEPVYSRLGYRPLGSLEMWERRLRAP